MQDRHAKALRYRRSVRLGWWLVFVWAAVVPAGIAVVEYNAPSWLAYGMFAYAISQAYVSALKMMGRWPSTEDEVAQEEEQQSMRHHHYHCIRNPEGFERLKQENFERDARAAIRSEAEALNERGQFGSG